MYGKILSVNLRHHFPLPFLSALGVCFLAFLVFGVTGLAEQKAAMSLEMVVCWAGPALLTPVFLPEQNREIRDVVQSKKFDYLLLCGIRAGYSAAALFLCLSVFAGIMRLGECDVSVRLLFGAAATALFLGAVGFLAAGVSGNTTVGYMAAMIYYLMNYGMRERLGVFYLFGMRGGEYEGKGWLFAGAAALLLGTFGIKIWMQREI